MGHKVKQSLVNSRIDFFYYAFRNVLLVSIPLLVVSGVVLSHLSFHSSATGSTSGSDNLAITISSSCTLSSVVNISHSAEVYNGNYLGDIGKTTIKTLCNDGNGYSVYAVGYSNNEEGNNKLISSEYPQYSIDTGLNTSGLTSQWAMKLNNIPDDPSPTPPVITSSYDDTYGLVPNDWVKVAGRTAGTTDMDEGSSFTTTYAVYASSNQHAGSYVGQVQYALIHPSAKPYYYFMQDVATWKDTELPSAGDSLQAIDSRDGKKYWVTRLADGNVWMTQNLDFDIVADEQDPTKMKTLTSEDTDLTDHSLTGAYIDGYSYDSATGITSWTPAISAKTINFKGTTVTGWGNSANTIPYSASKTDNNSTGHASLGNWYNWTAAIASSNSSVVASNPQNSICPKGWRLTQTNPSNDFSVLLATYNITSSNTNNLLLAPFWFVRPGRIDEAGLRFMGGDAYYWNNSGKNFEFWSDYLSLNNGRPKSYGLSIRCLAR